jgi:hypothetical protein
MANFYKSEDCPPSQQLLEFQTGDMPLEEGKLVRQHLVACEFCQAEVEFYAHYPQAEEETVEPTEIPAPLYDLAESLLSNKRNKLASLDNLLNDPDDRSRK